MENYNQNDIHSETINMKLRKRAMLSLLAAASVWTILTLWVQLAGKSKRHPPANRDADHKAIIIFNPDPLFNLDEKVCIAFAEGLEDYKISTTVVSYDLVDSSLDDYDLIVLCANTYNWSPDWKISGFIKKHNELKGKNCVAITLGSGSTARASRKHEENIKEKGGILLGSKTYWLLRPNDETRMEESNVEVAADMARFFGQEIAQLINLDK
jgi:hypothetical protein